ncbi:MAG: phospholipase D-like domain-containing protein [Gemmatimonadota bacterium]|nr:phospholipase D-like domain-containing protein [Gemmatimonadota bacterium]
MLGAIHSARKSIWIAQLAFDADCVAYTKQYGDVTLASALASRAESTPVDIRILLNATLLMDTTKALSRYFDGAAPKRGHIRVRGISHFPHLLHAKMVIVDGTKAFLIGSPFANGYWDEQQHRPIDARRPRRELAGRPLHDVSVRVEGKAVRDLETIYEELWSDHTPVPPSASDSLRVVRTAPAGVLKRSPHGATQILDALLDGIGRARSLIYIEHQYLSARPIVAALANALERERQLEIIVLTNQNADITAYRDWQNDRLREHDLLSHPRVGVFTVWTAAPCARRPGVTLLNQIFVHSKVVTIDDQWATVGTANLDGVSLHSYGDDFRGALGRRIFRDVRNFDVNIVLDGEMTSAILDLRTCLWQEHLNLPGAALGERPRNGWLSLWRERTETNKQILRHGTVSAKDGGMSGLILPYSTCARLARQLADLGIRANATRLELLYDPSWIQVHLSPNWVRNVFV